MTNQGRLYIVATPIGNLQDITYRAVSILQQVDFIAAEDTRHSQTLLQTYGIDKPLFPLHEHNERERCKGMVARLAKGEQAALISDAGTPLISDPGYHMIQAAIAEGVQVIPIPGACAAITALSVAGLATDKFFFAGFLPVKAGAREQVLQNLIDQVGTLIFYESPRRVCQTLNDMSQILGENRQAVVARELTKTFESVKRGDLMSLFHHFNENIEELRGEFVILVAGQSAFQKAAKLDPEQLLCKLLPNMALKDAVSLVVDITGERKNDIYQQALSLKE